MQESTYSLNEKYSHPKNTQRQTSWNPKISICHLHRIKDVEISRVKLEVASALLSMGTGNELALDMSDLETEKNRIPNSNLKNLIENDEEMILIWR